MKLKSASWAKFAALSTLVLAAASAQAVTYNFTLTGDYSASWQLDSQLTPDDIYDGQGFVLWDVVGNFSGAISPVVDLTFYNSDIGGGLQIDDFYEGITLVVADGQQLYTGTEDAPTFRLGSFALTEYQGTDTYTLTVAAVPEPATVVSMLAGLGLIGVAMRRRKTGVTEVSQEATAA